MRLINTLILTILWVLNSNAQEFGTHWISYPLPNDSSEVWFRKSYKFSSQPIQAFLSIASTGNYKLYINERNVTGSLLFEGQKEDILENHTFDVTRYLKSGNNVIAICMPRWASHHLANRFLQSYMDGDKTAFLSTIQAMAVGSPISPRDAAMERTSSLMDVQMYFPGNQQMIFIRKVGFILREAMA